MSTQHDRYYAAVCLAQMILEEDPGSDQRLIAEAVATVTGEVIAGRKNQSEFPQVASDLFQRLSAEKPRLRVVIEPGGDAA